MLATGSQSSQKANRAPRVQVVLNCMATAIDSFATSKTPSDFCHTCMQLCNKINTSKHYETRHHLSVARNLRHLQAAYEHKLYTSMCEPVKCNLKTSRSQTMFDYTEKELLPSLKRQPGQLYLATGLKFD